MAGSTAMWHHVISGGYGSMWGPSVLFFGTRFKYKYFSRMIRPFWIMNVKKMWSTGQPNNRPPILRRVCTTQFWWRDGLWQFITLTNEFRSNSPQEPLRVFGDSWTMICGWLDLKLASTRQYGLDHLKISAKDTTPSSSEQDEMVAIDDTQWMLVKYGKYQPKTLRCLENGIVGSPICGCYRLLTVSSAKHIQQLYSRLVNYCNSAR